MTPTAETGLATMLAIVGGVGLLIGIAVYVWYALALSRLFPRIDGEGWKGWVPVLNEAEILARGGVPAWSVVFYFIPLVQLYGLYLKVVATHRINRRFGRGAGMTVLAILLPPVWATVLAWGAAPYPEGDRLDALQPGPRRTPQPPAAPARDASGYTIPSLAPHGATPTQGQGLVFPDYAAPSAAPTGMGSGASAAAVSDAPAASSAPVPAPAPAPAAASASGPASGASAWGAPPQPPSVIGAPPAPGAPPASFAPPAAPPSFAAQPPAFVAPQSAPQSPAQPSVPQPAQPPTPPASAPPSPAVDSAHPTTGIMAAMGGSSPAPAPAPAATASALPAPVEPESALSASPVASAEPEARAVRPVPPSFRGEVADSAQPQAPTIRPVPTADAPPAAAAESVSAPAPVDAPPADAPPTAPADALLGGLTPDVDRTVVTPRPTDDDLDATVVVARRRGVRRSLVLDDGRTFALSGASVVIGRNPIGDPGEQRLAISDTTRTLSKTHARLVVHEDEWRLTDLHATNGVVVVGDDGTETLLDPGESVIGNGRFILGEVGMHVVAERDS